MASEVGICNRALQKLGAKRITSLEEDSPNARACSVAYEPVRDAELRLHNWNFAKKRATLPQNVQSPVFGRYNAFALPSDFLALRDPDPGENYAELERRIEGRNLITWEAGSARINYTSRVKDPNEMDPLFRELLATKIAMEICEEITQSNTKKDSLRYDYREILREAKKANAIEIVSAFPPEDTWITGRR